MRCIVIVMMVVAGGCNSLLGIEDLHTRDGAVPTIDAGNGDAARDAQVQPLSFTFQDGLEGYAGTVDTYLHSGVGSNSNSHATEDVLFWEDDINEKTGLLRFDGIIGAGGIPADAQIESAILTVFVTEAGDPTSSGVLYESAIDWVETVTYNSFGTAAGVQPSELGASVSVAPAALGARNIDVTESMQRWADAPTTNHGWVIVPTGSESVKCSSREAAQGQRPKLVVTIQP